MCKSKKSPWNNSYKYSTIRFTVIACSTDNFSSRVSGASSEKKMPLYIYIYFIFLANLCYYHFHFFFWWSIEFPQQNINQSETEIGNKKLSVEPYGKFIKNS